MSFFKKTISSLVLIIFVITSLFFTFPVSTAQAVGLEISPINVSDQALRGKECGVAVFGLCVPFTSLDSFAWFIGKVMIQQLTASVVNWINSGFDGNPSFVTDPAGFFENIADEEIGKMIEGGSLNALCSPFNLSIRLALAFKYRPFQKTISCTLTKVIGNTQNAIAGATINGFTAGDFRQGGWPAFASMTTEPQNNTYGAYIQAEDQLNIDILNYQKNKTQEINNGRGFLSWNKCTDIPKPGDQGFIGPPQAGKENDDQSAEAQYKAAMSGEEATYDSSKQYTREQHCEIQTPGSVIESQLETQLGSGVRQLELADSFNEIVNALVAQLVKQVLTAGLGGISGRGASDSSSYINQLQNEQNTQAAQLKAIKDNITPTLTSTIATETQFKNIKTTTTNTLIATKTRLQNVQACYNEKLPSLNPAQAAIAQKQIADADSIISTKINPLAQPLLTDINTTTNNLATLNDIQQKLSLAQSANEAYPATQSFSNLTQGNTLHTDANIAAATAERDTILSQMQSLNTDADNRLRECQLFPH